MKKTFSILILSFLFILILSSCSIINPYSNPSQIKEDEKFIIPKLEEDEPDPTALLEESYDEIDGLSLEGYDVSEMRDPFVPVFSAAEQISEVISEDELILRNIYSEETIKYADIELGGIIYKVTEGEVFAEYYVINTIGSTYVDIYEDDKLTRIYLINK